MKQQSFFKTNMVPSKEGSGRLFDDELVSNATPVTCLGKSFPDDDARRAYYTELLAEKLRDPEFRKIEGFPIGTDENILKLSDPPYYTACPNPWIADFIAEWEAEKLKIADFRLPIEQIENPQSKIKNEPYHREPFAADVSEGKNDPIYNAHSYHTKVPHKAIMRYILHYTEPGDIVFDGFCGTGMTGVAAKLCGDRKVVESLGFLVQPDGTILQDETDENGNKTWVAFSRLGVRRAVLNDLSPAATFIAYNYNTPVDVAAFEKEAKRILKEVEEECGWMYETIHTDGKTKGKINYTVWSDVFVCTECAEEFVFWDVAVKLGEGVVLEDFQCPRCKHWLSKSPANPKAELQKPTKQRRAISSKVDRAWETKFDLAIGQTVKQAKQVPVLISYFVKGKKFKKKPTDGDFELIKVIDTVDTKYWYPIIAVTKGEVDPNR